MPPMEAFVMMNPTIPSIPLSPRRRLWRTLVGAGFTLAGASVLAALGLVVFSEDPALAALEFKLGLALSSAVSALGQIVLMIGLWLLWSARRSVKRS
jgi:hypothetical protein